MSHLQCSHEKVSAKYYQGVFQRPDTPSMSAAVANTIGLLDKLGHLLDDRVGILRQVQEIRPDPGAPDFVYFSAQTCNVGVLNPKQQHETLWGSGVSVDRQTAMVKAVGEAIERYCAASYLADDLRLEAFESALFLCVPPEKFALFNSEQYGRVGFPYVPFLPTTRVRWVPALDLNTGKTTHVPAAMVFLPYILKKAAGEEPIVPQISTGLASHVNPALAALSGLCEVVERDAFTITWQARLARPKIRLDTLSPRNRDLVARLKRPGASVTLFYLAMDHGIPTILSAMRSTVIDAGALVLAAAAHPDPEQAVKKSLEELAQIASIAQTSKSARTKFTPGLRWEYVIDPKSHAAVYFDHANLHLAEFLFASRVHIAFNDIDNISTQDPVHDFQLLVQKIHAVGHEVLVADVTTEDVRSLGLFVVRVVIPGFHPLFMGHHVRALGGTRLWEVPQRLGYRGMTRRQGDNPFPHPFP
jgi:ribosomal protein S12 methylthiotransferase accessory factor